MLPVNSILRIIIIAFGPIIVNLAILLIFFIISLLTGPIISLVFKKYPSVISATVHIFSLVNHIFFFEFLWFLQAWDFSRTVLGFALSSIIQSWFLQLFTALFISSEFKHGRPNRAWWSGKWISSELGWHIFTQPFREYFCKVTELSYFASDFLIGHIILFIQIPILFIPYANLWHSMMLFWLKPSKQIRPRLLSKKRRRLRRVTVNVYTIVFFTVFLLFSSLIVLPIVATKVLEIDFEELTPEFLDSLIQPQSIPSQKKGLHKNLIKSPF